MAKLTDYRLLSFDVYGTLIDWDSGVITGLKPLLGQLESSKRPSREQTLDIYHELEKAQQRKTPDLPYSQLVSRIYAQFASRVGLEEEPTAKECEGFGQSVGRWPAFPDTVDALRRLGKRYKLVILSNVDRESFEATNAGPLEGITFDRIITAQEVGSYKPELRNFEYLLETVKVELGVEKAEVLQTAQSQFHDHHPAREMGIKSVWIEREGVMGSREEKVWDWRFLTLGDMADAVERELGVE